MYSYNLTHKINHRNILNSLQTIQNSPNNENLNTKLYYSPFKYPNTENINININNVQKPIINEKIKQKSNVILKQNININNINIFRENIDDKNLANLDELQLPKKEMKTSIHNKKVFLPGMKLIDSKDSERQLLKKRTLNSNN